MTVAPAPGPVDGGARPDSPFVGLVPFDEQDAPFFFGRSQEAGIVAANLRSTRLTILYGPSGVGKSSLLMAGAVHELHEEARSAAGESPFAVCVFRSWRGDPVRGVEEAARTALAPLGETGPPGATLAETLRSWTEGTGTLLVVLDQFEEYFQYHPDEDDGERLSGFAAELARVVNDPSLPVHVLLSIREDALARLDRFEGHILSLFSNYLRVEHLDRAAARRAVEGPIAAWNRTLPDGEAPYELEPALVDEVIDAAVGGRLVFAADGDAVAEGVRDRVEAPFLQLVLERLWRDAVERGDRELTLARLEELGGARRIVENHLLDALGRLTPAEQAVAADAFRFLVTRSKTKIAHPASDLADWTGRPEPEVKAVLDRLAGADSGRILRAVAPAGDDGRDEGYELFHDVLAEPILDWRRAYVQDRERLRVRRRFLRIGGTLLALVAVFAALGVWALVQRHDANRSAEATKWLSVAGRAKDLVDDRLPEALLLGLAANEHSETPEARNAMTLGLEQAQQSGVSAPLGDPSVDVRGVAFSPDGRTLASVDADGAIRLWDVRTRRPEGSPLILDEGSATALAFSPDGRTLAGGYDDGSVRRWDLGTHRPVGSPMAAHDDEVTSLAFSPDGRLLASGSYSGSVVVSDVRMAATSRVLGPLGSVYALAFSPDGRLLAAGGSGGTGASVRVWDTRTGGRLARLAGPAHDVNGVAFSPDSRSLVTAGTDGTAAWDARTGRLRRTLTEPGAEVDTGLAVSRAGTIAEATTNGTVWLWRLATGGAIGGPLQAGSNEIEAVALSPDGSMLATGGSGARLWDVTTHRELGAPLERLQASSYYGVAIGRKNTVAALDSDGLVRLWKLEDNSPIHSPVKGGAGRYGIALTTDGRLLTGKSNRGVEVREASSGRRVATLRLRSRPSGLAVSPDGKTVTAVDLTNEVTVWDLATRSRLEPLRGVRADSYGSVAFSPDGKSLATGSSDGVVRLWSFHSRRAVRSFKTDQDYVYGLAFNPDGRILATAGEDGTVRLWDVDTLRSIGEPLAPLAAPRSALTPTDPRGAVTGVAFTSDGRTLVSVDLDGSVRYWQGIFWSSTDDLEDQVCKLVAGTVRETDWKNEWPELAPGLPYEAPCPDSRRPG